MLFHEKALEIDIEGSSIEFFVQWNKQNQKIEFFCHETQLNFRKSSQVGKTNCGI